MHDADTVSPSINVAFKSVAADLAQMLVDLPSQDHGADAPIAREQRLFDAEHGGPAGDVEEPFAVIALVIVGRMRLIADMLAGIALVAEGGRDTVPPVAFIAGSAARSMLDAAAHGYWLAEPDLGHSERITRYVLDLMHDLQARNEALELVRQEHKEELDHDPPRDLIAVCDAYYVHWEPSKKGPWPSLGRKRTAAKHIMAEMMPSEKYKHHGAAVYSLMSDVAHGGSAGTFGDASFQRSGDFISIAFDREATLRRVALSLWALPKPLSTMFAYLGWDETPLRNALGSGVQTLSEAMAYSAEES